MSTSFPLNRTFSGTPEVKFTFDPKNSSVNSIGTGNYGGFFDSGNASWFPPPVGGSVPVPVTVANNLQAIGNWLPTKTAAEDFLKIQYTSVEVRCAISRRNIPAGSPVMLIGGMIISREAFENWLEENLASMICRHQDLHTDQGSYDE
jgi:hypothetical protein